MRLNLHPGDIVALEGSEFPKGEVQSKQPGGHVVVAWPSGLWWKYHNRELRPIVQQNRSN